MKWHDTRIRLWLKVVLAAMALCALIVLPRRSDGTLPAIVAERLEGYEELDKNHLNDGDVRALTAASECLPTDRGGKIAMLLGNRIFRKKLAKRVSYQILCQGGGEIDDPHVTLVSVDVDENGKCTDAGVLDTHADE